MGSSQPPTDEFLPFGYDFQGPEPLAEAPEPAPGNPLLSETDSKLLSSFFDDITSDQYNMPSFGEGLNFSNAWYDLPPQFMGSSTSLGQQPDLGGVSPAALTAPNDQMTLQRQALMSNMMPPPLPPASNTNQSPQQQPQYRQQHSEDVLHAAATLLQNGAAARGQPALDFAQSRRAMGPPVGHLRHQPLEEFKEETRRAQMTEYPDDNTFMEWMGTAALQPQRSHSRLLPVTEYQWGSDSTFNASKAYTPSSQKDTVEHHHQQQLDILGCLEPSQSADNTRPNSPTPLNSKPGPNASLQALKLPEDPEAPPRKRRKSKIARAESNADDDDEAEETSSSKASRRRKPKSEHSQASSPPASSEGGKRRKSAVNGGKASRENLTEEQKRENHIKSEQKRRTLIKEGFDDLCELIPGLQSRGLSKSTMLTMAAEYLEQLLQGNKELSEQLAALEGR